MSSAAALLAAALVSAAVAFAPSRPTASARLARLMAQGDGEAQPGPAVGPLGSNSVSATRLSCAAAGLAVALLLPALVGLGAGVAIALLGPVAVGRLEPRHVRRRRAQVQRDLPLMLDLLAACLSSGAPLAVAARSVADALRGPLGEDVRAVAVRLDLGADPAAAWKAFGTDDRTQRIGRALARASLSGTASSAALGAMADEHRSMVRRDGEAAARRVAVRVAAPLGLCFLPAFVLLAVVPAVLGAIAPVLPR